MQTQVQGEPLSLADALARAVSRLVQADVENPRLDAELLLAEACGLSRAGLMARRAPLTGVEAERLSAMLTRRSRREPLAYIVGRKEFFSIDFEVSPAVLVPRPDTEILVEGVLEVLRGRQAGSIIDIGTGSGAVAIAIAVHAQQVNRIVATDISASALCVARRNASAHRCADRISFVEADLFVPGAERFDLIVSNPPYIEHSVVEDLATEIAAFEPRVALDGGADGLDFYRRIADAAGDRLVADGVVMVEVGAGQAAAVSEIFRRSGLREISLLKDIAGVDRVVRARA